jgi:hypothetical protein
LGWSLDNGSRIEIDRIIAAAVTDPVGPEFMAPPPRSETAAAEHYSSAPTP